MFRLKRTSWGPWARRRASGSTGTAGVGGPQLQGRTAYLAIHPVWAPAARGQDGFCRAQAPYELTAGSG